MQSRSLVSCCIFAPGHLLDSLPLISWLWEPLLSDFDIARLGMQNTESTIRNHSSALSFCKEGKTTTRRAFALHIVLSTTAHWLIRVYDLYAFKFRYLNHTHPLVLLSLLHAHPFVCCFGVCTRDFEAPRGGEGVAFQMMVYLRHPHILTVMGAVVSKGTDYLMVTELMKHGSLYDLMHDNHTMQVRALWMLSMNKFPLSELRV